MALSQRLQMRQSQALVMTPQLMQAIKLLQLSNLDLATYVEGELEKNPLLERADPEGGETSGTDGAADGAGQDFDGGAQAQAEAGPGAGAPPAPRTGTAQPMAPSDWSSVGSGGREDSDYNLESFVSAAPTLADHLAEQLSLAITDPVRRMIGQFLIDMVDEAGYLAGDLTSVSENLR